MKTGKLFQRLAAFLCAAILMISLFAIPVYAEDGTESKGLSTGAIVGIIVGAVLLVVAVVLCIKFWDNIKKFLRVYKSEIKKVVWLPWGQTKKSTLVVLVVLILFGAAVCLVDFGLSRGFVAFIDLF